MFGLIRLVYKSPFFFAVALFLQTKLLEGSEDTRDCRKLAELFTAYKVPTSRSWNAPPRIPGEKNIRDYVVDLNTAIRKDSNLVVPELPVTISGMSNLSILSVGEGDSTFIEELILAGSNSDKPYSPGERHIGVDILYDDPDRISLTRLKSYPNNYRAMAAQNLDLIVDGKRQKFDLVISSYSLNFVFNKILRNADNLSEVNEIIRRLILHTSPTGKVVLFPASFYKEDSRYAEVLQDLANLGLISRFSYIEGRLASYLVIQP